MNSQQRIEKVWRFEEPDRVPFEFCITEEARANPVCDRLNELIDSHADNWEFWGPPWVWLGVPHTEHVEIIEDCPGHHQRIRQVRQTEVGEFVRITTQSTISSHRGYDKHFISTIEDLERVTQARRAPLVYDIGGIDYHDGRRFIVTGVPHPFGELARQSDALAFYSWFHTEPAKLHAFFDVYTRYIVAELDRVLTDGAPRYCQQGGLEMAIEPWLSPAMLAEFIEPYDQQINAVVHRHGGKIRHHCHGRVMGYLERFMRMGIDAIEPCEPAPQGNTDLREAKQIVAGKMLLCGNIPSPQFQTAEPSQTIEQVRQAIAAAGPGGGFVLRTTGYDGGTWETFDLPRVVANCEAMIETALRYGEYPIKIDPTRERRKADLPERLNMEVQTGVR